MVFRNTVPLLRGRSSLEDMLDSGLFVMSAKDEGDIRDDMNDSDGSADVPPQQKSSISGAEIKKVYHDTTNDMQRYPTSLLHWDDMVVADRGNTKKAKLFQDNQLQDQVQSSDDNRQQQKQKQQSLQRQDEYEIGNHDEQNAMSNMLVDGSPSAPSNDKMPVLGDASDSTSALQQKQNSTLLFEVLLDPTTNHQQHEHNRTETIVVLPEGPMLRGGRHINSELADSMYFGTLISERYESHGADTAYIMEAPEPGLSTSSRFPVVAPLLMLLALVMIWSKARRPQERSYK